jgi:cellobiose-specific phosphotransferase system component IIA
MKNSGEDEALIRKAIELLVRAWGEAELSTLVPLLQDENVQIRLSVVHALDSLGTTAATDALRAARAAETHRVVAAEMDDALGN